ncbi:transport protein [Companilactobacillus paralimentarius DSM 13238 = JCM 10415]|uniref:Transport protein n=1 Tax=Companilactobacillus paralimentarius DSM 13238 = JCM 10415 TaxID=1122151 RepID=A0A0R1P6T0_9LACO|nr:MFS transporter [Companilactobacillus paralimentarius]KRL28225.1 transport protein [Companilactobacillus paralimentarius DSM 13238 = JCM 10415]MDR4934383.1 MFS transporter [Companilactobacillus paralimentarius]
MKDVVSTRVKLSILAVGLLSFTGILIETSMNVTFPTLTKVLNVSLGTVQWLTTGYLLLTTMVMSTTAYILKKFNPRKVFIFAAVLCLIGSIVCMIAPNFPILMSGRLLQAVATGLSTPLMFNLIFLEVPQSKLGLYTGLAGVVISLAPALGPTYGGIVNRIWTWREIFVGVIPLIIILFLIGYFSIQGEAPGTKGILFDYGSVIGLAIIFSMILFTFDQAGAHGWISLNFVGWLIASIAVIGIFSWYNRRSSRQLIDFSILKLSVLRLRLFSYFSLQFINIGLSFVLPIFAQTALKLDSAQAGLMLLPGSILGAIVGPFAGYLYDKKGALIPLLFSGSLITIGSALFWFKSESLTLTSITLIYIILRIGFNFGFGTSLSDGSMQVQGSKKSDQNSLFSMMQQYAGSLGTNVLSVVISAVALTSGTKNIVYNTILGTKIDFIVLTVLSLLVLVSVIYVYFRYEKKNN